MSLLNLNVLHQISRWTFILTEQLLRKIKSRR